jgi:hypothetical protein
MNFPVTRKRKTLLCDLEEGKRKKFLLVDYRNKKLFKEGEPIPLVRSSSFSYITLPTSIRFRSWLGGINSLFTWC